MQHIRQAIVTEGKFDRVKLSSLFDAVIIETGGFGVFSSAETRELIRHFARTTGIVILTDSDPAGIKIRSYINSFVKEGTVLNAFVPAVDGKEKRKNRPGAAGILGVEGLDDETIISAVSANDNILLNFAFIFFILSSFKIIQTTYAPKSEKALFVNRYNNTIC